MICERSFPRIRYCKHRDTPRRNIVHWKAWNIPVVTRMIKAADREEVTPNCELPEPKTEHLAALFRRTGHEGSEVLTKLKGVLGEKNLDQQRRVRAQEAWS